MQIRTKLAIAVMAVALLAAAGLATIIRTASERNIRANAEAAVQAAASAFQATEQAEAGKLAATIEAILADPRYRPAFERRDRAALLALASPLFARLRETQGVTHWYFHLPDRTVLLRVHAPEQHGDHVRRSTLAQAAETGRPASGKELGATAFALRVVAPWVVDGKRIGYVELAEEIDGFLHRMKGMTGDDYCLIADKRQLDRAGFEKVQQALGKKVAWDALPDMVLVDTTMEHVAPKPWPGGIAAIPAGGLFLEEQSEAGRTMARGVAPVSDASGQWVGALMVHDDITRMHDNMTSARVGVVGLVIVVALLAAGLLIVAVNTLVFSRLARMTTTLEEVGARLVGGDYDVGKAVPPATAADEIGHFEDFFGRFIAVVGETLEGLTKRRR